MKNTFNKHTPAMLKRAFWVPKTHVKKNTARARQKKSEVRSQRVGSRTKDKA
jgi:hypothetical protein